MQRCASWCSSYWTPDVFHVSDENCLSLLDPLVESWDVDLDSLRLELTLNGDLVDDASRTFALVEHGPIEDSDSEPGLAEFLDSPQLNGHITKDAIRNLRRQRFGGSRPTKLYFYRALQDLGGPLHFRLK